MNREIRETDLPSMHINPAMARQALEAARQRLDGFMEQHLQLEQRAIGLLKIFLTLGMATLGAGIALAQVPSATGGLMIFVIGAVPMFCAAGCMLLALWGREYGTKGGDIGWWMQHGIIDSEQDLDAYMNAQLAFGMSRRAKLSHTSNQRALRFIHAGAFFALGAPVALAVAAWWY
ncbi:hypothetical protein [Algiphilus sp.]|uniref:hypothetical protein n=1 Tax=Algiphilus sp. TaxID=1872431 RepID=UPI003C5A2693